MRYSVVLQHDRKDCGAACLAAVAKHYGSAIPVTKIRQLAGTDLFGTNAVGMVRAAEHLGFEATAVTGDRKAFEHGFALPAIAHVKTPSGYEHYVVVHKIGRKKFVIADPGRGLVRMPREEFFDIWTGVMILLVPDNGFRKTNEVTSPLKRALKVLSSQKRLLTTVCAASLLLTVLGILASFYYRYIMDDVAAYGKENSLVTLSLGVLFLYTCQAVLMYFRSRLLQYMSQNLDMSIMLGYFDHVTELPMDFFGTRKTGEIISRFSDAMHIREAISGVALTVLIDSVMAVAGGIVLFRQNSRLFLIALGMVIVHSIVVFIFSNPIKNYSRMQMESSAQMNSYMVESLNGIETVKAFGREKLAQNRTERFFLNFLDASFKNGALASGQSAVNALVGNVGFILIMWAGTSMVLEGRFSFGQLITFNALLGYFTGPLQRMINLQPVIENALVSAERVAEIMDLETEDTDSGEAFEDISLNDSIEVSDLRFRYGTRSPVLDGLTLSIRPGERIALVGSSGSGKTTFAKLLLRFYEFEEGMIRFGSTEIRDIPKPVLRKKIAYISQNNFLFSGTIKDNLFFGNAEATMDEVREACRRSRADEFIEKMPGKYSAMLEERGENLSGGQKQRLIIARALLRKPELLIMDEATSSLDAITERGIQKTIDELPDSISVILIAHRLSTVKNCDRIFVMENGTIVESGTHTELIRRHGQYYDLWKDQFPDIDIAEKP